jgi:hypothetical protein
MGHLLDSSVLGYAVLGLVPNLFLMLFVMARMHRDLRVVTAKLSIVESDNRVLDETLRALADELRQRRTPEPLSQVGP